MADPGSEPISSRAGTSSHFSWSSVSFRLGHFLPTSLVRPRPNKAKKMLVGAQCVGLPRLQACPFLSQAAHIRASLRPWTRTGTGISEVF